MLAFCFWLSGFAALVYQTAWTRQFALVFGTSELAVATVLAAYMGGLALGAWLVERWLPRVSRPVLIYAGLELGIGAGATLLVPGLLAASEWLLRALFGGQSGPPDSSGISISLFYLVSAFVVLSVPTVLMGATLPLLARHAVRDESHISRRVGLLYAVNTAGAVVGALATAFWLLPTLGLTWTVRFAAIVNVLIFGVATMLARRGNAPAFVAGVAGDETASAGSRALVRAPAMNPGPSRDLTIKTPDPIDASSRPLARLERVPPRATWILPLMLASGAVTFFHEVLWTRMLSHVLGSSIHAFGVMVASFLAGIALGGAVAARVARTRDLAHRAFAIAQLGCALAAMGGFALLERGMPADHGLLATAAFGATILLPLTFFIGTTFPLAVRILALDVADAASASARVYAWNTVGAIVGSLAAGFVLIPWLRFEGAVQLAVIASCVIAVAHTWRVIVPTPRVFGSAVLAAGLAVCIFFRPSVPENLLHRSPLNIAADGEIAYYEVGRAASVVMLRQDGGLVLRTNGLPEAMMETHGSVPYLAGESWLAPLAVIARPDVESMLVVGYGGGVVVEAVPPSVRAVDVIELEPKVIEANRATASLRKHDPLTDPRLTLISNDARGALNLTDRKYDAIVSQPSHPWTAGASHLYTLEFMRQVREHLSEDGVFVQWMNARFLDESLLRSLAATLVTAFGEVRLYRPDPDTLLFLAATKPLDLEAGLVASGRPLSDYPAHYSRHGIHVVEDLLATLALDADGARSLAAGAEPITDDHNRMATASSHDLGRGLDRQSLSQILAAYDPLRRSDGGVFRAFRDRLSFSYIERRMAIYLSSDPTVSERIAAINRGLGPSTGNSMVNAVLRDPLNGAGDVVARATELARAKDWEALSELDHDLSSIPWTDVDKPRAIQLRAEWRTHVVTPALRQKAGDECLSILDEAIVARPTLTLYGLRARCGSIAGRNDVVTESLWSLGDGTYHNAMRLPPERRTKATQDLWAIILGLENNLPLAESAAFDGARRDEVTLKLRAHISRLAQ